MDINSKICYQSSAKVIISGEHSVVYGYEALCVALSMKTNLSIQYNDNSVKGIEIKSDLGHFIFSWDEINNHESNNHLIQAIQIILQMINQNQYPLGNYLISIHSDIPLKAGLGSSASFAVVLCAGLYHFITGIKLSREKLIQQAKLIENIFHGNTGSGLDVTVSAMGGLLLYKKNMPIQQLELPENHGFSEISLLLINTGIQKQGGTGEVVGRVRKVIEEFEMNEKGSGFKIVEEIGNITKEIKLVITNKNVDYSQFSKLIARNQQLLKKLSISVKECDHIVRYQFIYQFNLSSICEKHNVACKLTGAGDGGFCIAFLKKGQNNDQLLEELKKEKFNLYFTSIDMNGVLQI